MGEESYNEETVDHLSVFASPLCVWSERQTTNTAIAFLRGTCKLRLVSLETIFFAPPPQYTLFPSLPPGSGGLR